FNGAVVRIAQDYATAGRVGKPGLASVVIGLRVADVDILDGITAGRPGCKAEYVDSVFAIVVAAGVGNPHVFIAGAAVPRTYIDARLAEAADVDIVNRDRIEFDVAGEISEEQDSVVGVGGGATADEIDVLNIESGRIVRTQGNAVAPVNDRAPGT